MSSTVHRTAQPPPRRQGSAHPSRPGSSRPRTARAPVVVVPATSPRGLKTAVNTVRVPRIGSLSLGNTLITSSPRRGPHQQMQQWKTGRSAVPSHVLMPEKQPLPPQTSPRAAQMAKQLSTGSALSTVRRSWSFLKDDDLALHAREHYPDPPLEVYHTQSRIDFKQAAEDAQRMGEKGPATNKELVDLDGDGEPDVAVGGGTDSSKTMKSIRADLNVSPTRRYGRVIMLEHNAGMLLDQDNKWVLRFDPRDQVVTFKVAHKVSYNRIRDDASGMHNAVRLMKSHRSRKNSSAADGDGGGGGSGSNNQSGLFFDNISEGSMSSSHQTSPSQRGLSPVDPHQLSASAPEGAMTRYHAEGGIDLTATADGSGAPSPLPTEEIDEDSIGLGLEYHTFLMKAKGKKGISITSDPESINNVVQKLRNEFQMTASAEEAQKRLSPTSNQQQWGKSKTRSIFHGKGNRAPDHLVDEWEKHTYGGGKSSTNTTNAAHHAHWFVEPDQWMSKYDETIKSARAAQENAKARQEEKEKRAREQLKAEALSNLAATRAERGRRVSMDLAAPTMSSRNKRKPKKRQVRLGSSTVFSESSTADVAPESDDNDTPEGEEVNEQLESPLVPAQPSSNANATAPRKSIVSDPFVVATPRRKQSQSQRTVGGAMLGHQQQQHQNTHGQVSPYRIRSTEITNFVRRFTAVHPESPIALASSKQPGGDSGAHAYGVPSETHGRNPL